MNSVNLTWALHISENMVRATWFATYNDTKNAPFGIKCSYQSEILFTDTDGARSDVERWACAEMQGILKKRAELLEMGGLDVSIAIAPDAIHDQRD